MILNLKQFNTHITYRHFKMESINQVIDIVRPNVYMASIDLRCLLLIHPSTSITWKIFKICFYIKNISTHACLKVMGQPCGSLQKYPKFPFHTYKVKNLYRWCLLTNHTCRVILMKDVLTTFKRQLNY